MTYLADTRARARGSRASGAMGLGDALTSTSDPTAILIGEVNRFGPHAPASYRYVAQTYPLATGNVPPAVAVSAALIYQRRAQDAVVKFGDKGSLELMARANEAVKAPTTYVPAHILDVTQTIKAYADSVGLPASRASVVGKISSYLSQPMVLAMVGAGALAYMFFKKKGR